MNEDQNILHNILMVAYLYLPMNNTGTRRTIKFVRYLPEFGYRPMILTTGTRGSLPDDNHQLIFRTDDILGKFRHIYRKLKLRNIPPEQIANTGALQKSSRIVRFMDDYLPPDPEILWYFPAIKKGLNIIQTLSVKMIYSTSSPETNHLVALKLKRKTGLPWVADFRDGWMFEPLRPTRLNLGYRRRIEARWEREVILNADRLITVNETVANNMAERYPQAASRIYLIPNGYDSQDFSNLQRNPSVNKFRIVHTGAILRSRFGRSIQAFIDGVELINHQKPEAFDDIEIILVGDLTEEEINTVAKSTNRQNFILPGQVPYSEALQYQLDANLLLLVIGSSSGVSTTKLYEYLATGNPILALSGPSDGARLINDLKAGLVVEPENADGICSTILHYYDQWKNGNLINTKDPRVHRFDRRELTRKLAQCLDEVR